MHKLPHTLTFPFIETTMVHKRRSSLNNLSIFRTYLYSIWLSIFEELVFGNDMRKRLRKIYDLHIKKRLKIVEIPLLG